MATFDDLTPCKVNEDGTAAWLPSDKSFINEGETYSDYCGTRPPCKFSLDGQWKDVLIQCAEKYEGCWVNSMNYSICCGECLEILLFGWRVHFFGYFEAVSADPGTQKYKDQCARVVNMCDENENDLLTTVLNIGEINDDEDDDEISEKDRDGRAYDQVVLVETLVDLGVNTNSKTNKETPNTFLAFQTGRPIEIMSTLFKGGADPNLTNSYGSTLIDVFPYRFCQGIPEESIWYTGEDVSTKNICSMFNLLVENGALPSEEAKLPVEERSPALSWVLLFIADRLYFDEECTNSKKASKILLEKYSSKSDPNYVFPNSNGCTLLFDDHEDPEFIRLCLKLGADPTIKNKDGALPIDDFHPGDEIYEILKEAMDSIDKKRSPKRERSESAFASASSASSSSCDEDEAKKQKK